MKEVLGNVAGLLPHQLLPRAVWAPVFSARTLTPLPLITGPASGGTGDSTSTWKPSAIWQELSDQHSPGYIVSVHPLALVRCSSEPR